MVLSLTITKFPFPRGSPQTRGVFLRFRDFDRNSRGDSQVYALQNDGLLLRRAAATILNSFSCQKSSLSANWICRERVEPVQFITPAVATGASPAAAPAKT